jgi:hypothetical protein
VTGPLSFLDPRVFDGALNELAEKSKKRIYQRDFEAWQADMLGERTYARMVDIGNDVLFSQKPRTMVKSANGTAKTFQAARWGMWWATAFDPEESLVIFTAPTLSQVEKGVFQYIKACYGTVKQAAMSAGKPMPWPGWITEQNDWKYATPGGNQTLAFGRVPSAQDAVSTFQGARKPGGRNFIILDEAGGVSTDIFTAIEALMTGGDSRMVGIGNPDRRGTDFYRIFADERVAAEYNLHTISAYELPTMTGEKVYPNDPEKEALMLKGLTSAAWIAHKERVWKTGGEIVFDEKLGLERNLTGKPDARFLAKVLGEFPNATDTAFFAEEDIDFARNNEIVTDGEEIVMGVDVAAMGADESVVMVNQGGRCRVFDKEIAYDDGGERRTTTGTWAKEDEVTSARRVHAIAKHIGATEVRLDGSGLGGGIASMLERLDEFNDKTYVFIRVMGAASSADKDRWERARDENHDQLRELLHEHKLDIDYDDVALRDQLLAVTYELNNRGAVKIAKKSDMRSEMHGSPDRLDALIYATISTRALLDTQAVQKGDIVLQDPWAMLNAVRHAPGMPI